MSEKDDYYLTSFKEIDQHIADAEGALLHVTPHDYGSTAMVNAVLAASLALVEIGKLMGALTEELKRINLEQQSDAMRNLIGRM